MHIPLDDFRVVEGEDLDLDQRPTAIRPLYKSRKHYAELIAAHIAELTVQQSLLYANHSHSLLLIFQAMDAAGKDSAIQHVMSGVNPQSCQVFSFKHPSAEELSHDFLWRSTRCLPERGNIGIFNRSSRCIARTAHALPQVRPCTQATAAGDSQAADRCIVNWARTKRASAQVNSELGQLDAPRRCAGHVYPEVPPHKQHCYPLRA